MSWPNIENIEIERNDNIQLKPVVTYNLTNQKALKSIKLKEQIENNENDKNSYIQD